MRTTFSSIVLLTAAVQSVSAANNWAVPCLQGSCEFDIAATNTSGAGNMRIWGAPNAISDITEAAGWVIMGCNGTTLDDQEIRLVCKDDTTSTGCDHIYEGGAVGTVVRLPQSCGKGPFAVVTRAWVHEDQTISDDAARKLSRRQVAPEVKGLALSTNFAAANATNGDVNIAITGLSVGDRTVLEVPVAARRSFDSRSHMKALKSRFSFKDAFKKVFDKVKDVVSGAVNDVKDAVDDINSFDQNLNKTLPPIDVDKSFNIVSVNTDCGDKGKASLQVDAATKAHAEISFGVVAAGTLIPPKLSDFSLSTGLNADLDGKLNFVASASGSPLDTGVVTLFQAGIPGLDFPGILTIGPTFKINGRAALDVAAQVDLTVDLAYSIRNAVFAIPKDSNLASTGDAQPASSPLKLSVSPQVAARGTLAAHLIPRLDIGISALAGTAEATVFVDVDASATLTLSLDAGTTVTKTLAQRDVIPTAAVQVAPKTMYERAVDGAQGCVDLVGGVVANAGAEGSFFGLFDASKTVPVFTKQFQIFKKCFGNVTPAKRDVGISPVYHGATLFVARADPITIACPLATAPAPEAIIDEQVDKASITAI